MDTAHWAGRIPISTESVYSKSMNLFWVQLQSIFPLLAFWEGESWGNEQLSPPSRSNEGLRGCIYNCRAGQILSGQKPNSKVEGELDCFAIKMTKLTMLWGMRGEGSNSVELLMRAIFHCYLWRARILVTWQLHRSWQQTYVIWFCMILPYSTPLDYSIAV